MQTPKEYFEHAVLMQTNCTVCANCIFYNNKKPQPFILINVGDEKIATKAG